MRVASDARGAIGEWGQVDALGDFFVVYVHGNASMWEDASGGSENSGGVEIYVASFLNFRVTA